MKKLTTIPPKTCRIYVDLNKKWNVLWYPSKRRGSLPVSFFATSRVHAIALAEMHGRTHARFGISADAPVVKL